MWIGLIVAALLLALILVAVVAVGGYALYIWIAHPSSFSVPFRS
ncbi:hypothetical protein [Leifsonia sp. LS1]|nr:hypothetical protein [Leifsonia sp. LS1]